MNTRQTEGPAILDTSFIVDYFEALPATQTLLNHSVDDSEGTVEIPTIVLYELYHGAILSDSPHDSVERVNSELEWANRIGFDPADAEEAGRIQAELTGQGRKIGSTDVLLAGIARNRNQCLITADNHFDEINGLAVFNHRTDDVEQL
ncbi:PIN domain-containing protein [Haladaptatus pallidirubidus]|uniref:PIN domain-containing protein n=1 Tax=Haladaptatus pallidirubidus TaxID=1008152 RepID=A0AAV3UNK3_9EURY|nr:PIN domain-containing protein [Haladaptatus pallidirubidus]